LQNLRNPDINPDEFIYSFDTGDDPDTEFDG
jgi:hypothetical protein